MLRRAKFIEMRILNNLSYIGRVFLSMACSLLIYMAFGFWLFSVLSGKTYMMQVDATASGRGTLELFWDAGSGFKEHQKVVLPAIEGRNPYTFSFKVNAEERLKLFRLDFGPIPYKGGVQIHSMKLRSGFQDLFNIDGEEISAHTIYSQGLLPETESGLFEMDFQIKPFDPYLVLSPVNELVLPAWARIGLLTFPWFVFFIGPVFQWTSSVFRQKEYILPLIALFIISIPLKPAWITFTTLLIFSFALSRMMRSRKFEISRAALAILFLFLVPLLLLGEGRISKLSIPLGFVWFPIVVSCIDLTGKRRDIQMIYTRVFFTLMAITLVSWMILMLFEGYFYGITISNYFTDIKSTAHRALFWLHYPHTTFLSFFALAGALFCLDFYRNNIADRNFSRRYWLFLFFFMLVLGSRIGLAMACLLPLLAILPVRYLKLLLIPLWLLLFGLIWYFIGNLDPLRASLWEWSVDKIAGHLWLGHGTGSSEIILPDKLYLADGKRGIWMPVNHSHNQFLTYILENGIIGIIGVGIAFISLWLAFIRWGKKSILLFFFFLLLLMTVESPFRTTNVLYLISFVLSLYAVPPHINKPLSRQRE